MDAQVAHEAVSGGNQLIVASIIFFSAYAIIVSEKIHRTIVALLGAGLMIFLGILHQEEAIYGLLQTDAAGNIHRSGGVDFNTLGLLTGMMIIVAITKKTGVFQYTAIRVAKWAKGEPWKILVGLSVVTAVFSAFLDNVTTVLLIAPVSLLIADELEIDPFPILFAEVLASNIGGTATLIGDPPNIMIGSATHLTFNDFILMLTPVVVVIFIVTIFLLKLIFKKKMSVKEENRQRILAMNEKESITDSTLLKKCGAVLGLVILGFVIAHPLGVEPATIAITGAALLFLIMHAEGEDMHHIFGEVEWVTIFFFLGLFILVTGIEKAGLIRLMAEKVLEFTQGSKTIAGILILWVSAVASAIVDNIPFVATMIPLIKNLAPHLQGAPTDPEQFKLWTEGLWWALSLGACLGGNGSLVGASANLIVAGFAERAGRPITFMKFTKLAFPLMIVSIIISTVYLLIFFL
ncbi:ArsB/NhaD family transporter [Deferribacter abyssi]|uniref:ArsB/NhaD family transporter n=1 Tax=Deferribacter abyssi TaxID=213806 RepID=UPI003C1F9F27